MQPWGIVGSSRLETITGNSPRPSPPPSPTVPLMQAHVTLRSATTHRPGPPRQATLHHVWRPSIPAPHPYYRPGITPRPGSFRPFLSHKRPPPGMSTLPFLTTSLRTPLTPSNSPACSPPDPHPHPLKFGPLDHSPPSCGRGSMTPGTLSLTQAPLSIWGSTMGLGPTTFEDLPGTPIGHRREALRGRHNGGSPTDHRHQLRHRIRTGTLR